MKLLSFNWLFSFLCLFFLLGNIADVFGQNKIKSKSKIEINNQKNNDKRRKEVESLLLNGDYQHDGSGELIYIGTIESVPALLKVLKNHPPTIYLPCKNDVKILPPPLPLKDSSFTISQSPKEENKKDCSPKKFFFCTYAHAVMALRKITGQNFVEYEDWQNWWVEYSKGNEILQLK